MKMSSSGFAMVAAVMGSMALIPACGTEGSAGDDIPIQDPVSTFAAPQGTAGDSTKACATRPDLASSFTVASGSWGSWQSCYQLCPAGSYAYTTTLRTESSQGVGDDSAMNGIQLECYNRAGAYQGFITSQLGSWGTWGTRAVTSPYTVANPFIGGQMLVEGPQGAGDDSAANLIVMRSMSGTNSFPSANTSWGSWQPLRTCPAGQAICGVNTRVEGSQGAGDDTALNGVAFACCSF